MATLLHDDIIDNSSLRRHKPSPLSIYGSSNTLLAGDFLLVRAFSLCSYLPREIVQATEKACISLTEGEIMETSQDIKDHTPESTLIISKKKTASLFKLATFSAATIAGFDSTKISFMSSFGENLGIAFQALDDVLDVVSDEETFGKKPGADIKERKPSLINVLWLNTNSELAKSILIDNSLNSFTKSEEVDQQLKICIKEIISLGIVEEVRILARTYANKALKDLEATFEINSSSPSNKNSPKKKINENYNHLKFIVDYTLERVS